MIHSPVPAVSPGRKGLGGMGLRRKLPSINIIVRPKVFP